MSEPSVIDYPNKLRETFDRHQLQKQMWMWIWLYCRYLISICWTVTGRCALGTGCGFQVLPLRIVFSVQTVSLPLCTAWGWIPLGNMSGKERVHFPSCGSPVWLWWKYYFDLLMLSLSFTQLQWGNLLELKANMAPLIRRKWPQNLSEWDVASNLFIWR